jgi:hypothetical protein
MSLWNATTGNKRSNGIPSGSRPTTAFDMTHWRPAHDVFALRLLLQLSPAHTDAQFAITPFSLHKQASSINSQQPFFVPPPCLNPEVLEDAMSHYPSAVNNPAAYESRFEDMEVAG